MLFLLCLVPVVITVMFLLDIQYSSCGNESKKEKLSIWHRISGYRNMVRRPREVSKQLIMALSQRKIYDLKAVDKQTNKSEDEIDVDMRLWKLIIATTVDLDSLYPLIKSTDAIIDSFCDRVENIVVKYQDTVCELKKELNWITKEMNRIDEELCEMKCTRPTQAKTRPVIQSDLCRSLSNQIPGGSIQCPTVADFTKTNEESYFASVFEQLVYRTNS